MLLVCDYTPYQEECLRNQRWQASLEALTAHSARSSRVNRKRPFEPEPVQVPSSSASPISSTCPSLPTLNPSFSACPTSSLCLSPRPLRLPHPPYTLSAHAGARAALHPRLRPHNTGGGAAQCQGGRGQGSAQGRGGRGAAAGPPSPQAASTLSPYPPPPSPPSCLRPLSLATSTLSP